MTFRGIADVAEGLDVPQHVLRFWETRFGEIRPMKRAGRRYYRPADVELITGIRHLLHVQRYTIEGAQAVLRARGVSHIRAIGRGEAAALDPLDAPSNGIASADLSPEQRDALTSALADPMACRALADRCLAQTRGAGGLHA